MTPPTSYADFVHWLDRFSDGSPEAITSLERGALDWTPGVADRLFAHITGAFSRRFDLAQSRMSRDLTAARIPADLSVTLGDLRRHIEALHRLCRLPVLPEELQDKLTSALRDTVSKLAAETLKCVRDVGPPMETAVRAARMDSWVSTPGRSAPGSHTTLPGQRVGRRVLF